MPDNPVSAIGSAIGLGSSVVGGINASNASENASEVQLQATRESLALQKEQFDRALALQQEMYNKSYGLTSDQYANALRLQEPYLQTGLAANNELATLYGLYGINPYGSQISDMSNDIKRQSEAQAIQDQINNLQNQLTQTYVTQQSQPVGIQQASKTNVQQPAQAVTSRSVWKNRFSNNDVFKDDLDKQFQNALNAPGEGPYTPLNDTAPYLNEIYQRIGPIGSDALVSPQTGPTQQQIDLQNQIATLQNQLSDVKNKSYGFNTTTPALTPEQREQAQKEAMERFYGSGDFTVGGLNRDFYNSLDFTAGGLTKDFETSPDYQFRLDEGIKGIQSGAAARNGALSGATQKALTKYSGDLASGEYNNWYNKITNAQNNWYNKNTTAYNNYVNKLAGMAGAGQTATGSANTLGANFATTASNLGTNLANSAGTLTTNYGNTASDLTQDLGSARASGYINSANALTNMLGNVGNTAMLGSYLYGNPYSNSYYDNALQRTVSGYAPSH